MISSFRYIFLALCLAPLFFIRFQHTASPFIAELLDVGHIGVFFILGWFAFPLVSGGVIRRISVLIVAVFAASILIEGVQEAVGRAFQWHDIASNYLGLGLSIALRTYLTEYSMKLKRTAICSFIVLFVVVFIECQTFLKLAAGKVYFQVNAPVLADFKYAFELANWTPNFAKIEIVDSGLLVETEAEPRFSGANFRDFPSDWRQYQTLNLVIDNLESEPMALTLKITDLKHEIGRHDYDERYNGSFKLLPGSNNIAVDLSLIENAPKSRLVNMAEVKRIELFTSKTGGIQKFKIQTLYLSSADQEIKD